MSYPHFMLIPQRKEFREKMFLRNRCWLDVKREDFFVINLEFFNKELGLNCTLEDFKKENANRMRYCVEKVLREEYDATPINIKTDSLDAKLYKSNKDGKYYFYTMQRFKRSRAIRDVDYEKFFVVRIYSIKPEYFDVLQSQNEYKFYAIQKTTTVECGFSHEKDGRTYYSNTRLKT